MNELIASQDWNGVAQRDNEHLRPEFARTDHSRSEKYRVMQSRTGWGVVLLRRPRWVGWTGRVRAIVPAPCGSPRANIGRTCTAARCLCRRCWPTWYSRASRSTCSHRLSTGEFQGNFRGINREISPNRHKQERQHGDWWKLIIFDNIHNFGTPRKERLKC